MNKTTRTINAAETATRRFVIRIFKAFARAESARVRAVARCHKIAARSIKVGAAKRADLWTRRAAMKMCLIALHEAETTPAPAVETPAPASASVEAEKAAFIDEYVRTHHHERHALGRRARALQEKDPTALTRGYAVAAWEKNRMLSKFTERGADVASAWYHPETMEVRYYINNAVELCGCEIKAWVTGNGELRVSPCNNKSAKAAAKKLLTMFA